MIRRRVHNRELQSRMNSSSWHGALVHLTFHIGARCVLSFHEFQMYGTSWPVTLSAGLWHAPFVCFSPQVRRNIILGTTLRGFTRFDVPEQRMVNHVLASLC